MSQATRWLENQIEKLTKRVEKLEKIVKQLEYKETNLVSNINAQ